MLVIAEIQNVALVLSRSVYHELNADYTVQKSSVVAAFLTIKQEKPYVSPIRTITVRRCQSFAHE